MGKHEANLLSNPLQSAILFDSEQNTQTSNSFPIGIYVNFRSETHMNKLYTELAYFCSLSRCRSFYLLAMLATEMVLY